MINKYLHRDDHGIDPHCDQFGCTYESKDPITSFSYQIGSVLAITLPTAERHRLGSNGEDSALLVYQPPNSILVMGGEFQKQLYHCVMTWSQMMTVYTRKKDSVMLGQVAYKFSWIDSCHENEFNKEMDRLTVKPWQELFRWNMTVRWIRNHQQNCQYAAKSFEVMSNQSVKPFVEQRISCLQNQKANEGSTSCRWQRNPAEREAKLARKDTSVVNSEQVGQFIDFLISAINEINSEDQACQELLSLGSNYECRQERISELERRCKSYSELEDKLVTLKPLICEQAYTKLVTALHQKTETVLELKALLKLLWSDVNISSSQFVIVNQCQQGDPKRIVQSNRYRVTMSCGDLKELFDNNGLCSKELEDERILVFDFDTLEKNSACMRLYSDVRAKEPDQRVKLKGRWTILYFELLGVDKISCNDDEEERCVFKTLFVKSGLHKMVNEEKKMELDKKLLPVQRLQHFLKLLMNYTQKREMALGYTRWKGAFDLYTKQYNAATTSNILLCCKPTITGNFYQMDTNHPWNNSWYQTE